MAGARQEELRLALAMTGGVSLAIWMGGVANEVYRLLHEQSVWGDVFDVMGQHPVVDLVSGTSAGGLNGALLAAAMAGGNEGGGAHDDDLGRLRDLWIHHGDFDALMRPPNEKNAPSLMMGDKYFMAKLADAFAQLLPDRGVDPSERGMDHFKLFTTMTLMHGRARRYVDSLGRPIDELDHRGTMHFAGADLFPTAEVPKATIAQRLALASRSSASYPVAFEASWVPIRAKAGEKSADEDDAHPDMAAFSWWTGSGWTMDGGLVLNRPIRPLLLAIPDQPAATTSVRRLLLYVTPNPAGTIDLTTEKREPPTLIEIGQAIGSSRFAQSIADDYEMLRKHNDDVERRGQLHDEIWALTDPDLQVTAGAMATMWRDARAAEFARSVMTRVAERGAVSTVVPLTKTDAISGALVDYHCRALSAAFDGNRLVDAPLVLATDIAPLDHAVRRAQWLARNALRFDATTDVERLHRIRDELRSVADIVSRVEALQVDAFADAVERALEVAGIKTDTAATADSAARMRRLHVHVDDLEAARQRYLRELVAFLVSGRTAAELGEDVAAVEPGELLVRLAATVVAWADEVARTMVLRDVATDATYVCTRRADDLERYVVAAARREQQRALREPEPTDGQALTDADRVVLRDVAAAPLVGTGVGDEIIELLQVSAATPNAFDETRSTPEQKLTGMQLHHFGAFYKASWRANDWMWGRLDGAMQLLQAVLDPERLRHRYRDANRQGAVEHIVRGFASAAIGATLGDPRTPNQPLSADNPPEIGAAVPGNVDLPFLTRTFATDWAAAWHEVEQVLDGDGTEAAPLERTTAWLARRLQLEALRDELPVVAAQALNDRNPRDDMPAGLAEFLTAVRRFAPVDGNTSAAAPSPGNADDVVAAFKACRIGEERITDQVTTNRFVQTASHAFATSVNALSGTSAPGAVRPVAGGVRGLSRATNVVARLVTSRSAIALATLAFVVMGASAVVALALVRHAQPWPFVAGIAVAVVVAAFVVALLRTPVGTGAGVLAAVTLALWGGITLAVSSWAGDLLHVVAALVAAALLLGLLSNVGRRLFLRDGVLGFAGAVTVVLVLAAAAFATWQAVDGLEFHAGHDAGPCALAPDTATTTTVAGTTTTTQPPAKRPSVVCVRAKNDAAARGAALGGAFVIAALFLVLLVTSLWRLAKRLAAAIGRRFAAKKGQPAPNG